MLWYGTNDYLVSPKDSHRLISKLKLDSNNVIEVDYNHLDFLWATNVKSTIYDIIIDTVLAS